jgi:hypothetical protein
MSIALLFAWLAWRWAEFKESFERPVRAAFVAERPTELVPRVLYVTSAGEKPAFGFMRCPCGCGETLHLRFAGERRPRWRVTADAGGRASLTPSVWRSTGCKSHFILSAGRVQWCRDFLRPHARSAVSSASI